jgi:hypothetical protein
VNFSYNYATSAKLILKLRVAKWCRMDLEKVPLDRA